MLRLHPIWQHPSQPLLVKWTLDSNKMECFYGEIQVGLTVKDNLQAEPCSAKVCVPATQWFYLLTSSDIFQSDPY